MIRTIKTMRLSLLILTVVLLGCSEKKNSSLKPNVKKEIIGLAAKNDAIGIEEDKSPTLSERELETEKDVVHLNFKEFIVELDSVEVWDKNENLKEIQKDTAKVFVEIGEPIEGQTWKIIPKKNGEIKIYQRFENSITIMKEGPHCDLTDWRHFDSEWKELQLNDGNFLTESYSDKERGKFIQVDMKELRDVVRKQCGNDWAELIKGVKSPTEYPSGVGMSSIFLKIDYKNPQDGTVKESIISFEIPLGS